MESMTAHLYLVCKLFLLMGIGWVLRKRSILSTSGKQTLTDLVIQLVLPSSIIASFLSDTATEQLRQTAIIFFLSLGIQLFSCFLAMILYRRSIPEHKPVMQYGTICSNSGILGTPIVEGIFGSDGLLLSAVYLIPPRIIMWTFGLSIFTKKTDSGFIKKTATHPCIVAVVIGLILMLTGCPLPPLLSDCLLTVSKCNTPLCMFLVGSIVAEMPLRMLLHKDTIYFCTVRLVLLPLAVLAACSLLGFSPLVRNIAVILTAMPAGATTSILALKYEADAPFASACTAGSTILSLIALPIWCQILL